MRYSDPGLRQKAEGRRQKAEGRRQKAEGVSHSFEYRYNNSHYCHLFSLSFIFSR
jgi:hypothetical protein